MARISREVKHEVVRKPVGQVHFSFGTYMDLPEEAYEVSVFMLPKSGTIVLVPKDEDMILESEIKIDDNKKI